MTKQLSNCCKVGIRLTGSPNHEDGFACEKCGRIIGTPLTNQPIEKKCICVKGLNNEPCVAGCSDECLSCHQEKLPNSSYEVTCGRCEKSIKHSCGRV